MNHHSPQDPWTRLVSAARQARTAREERDATAPYGFATRVTALGFGASAGGAFASLWDRFSLRAAGVALLAAVLALAANYREIAPRAATAEVELVPQDAISLMVDLGDEGAD